MRTIRASNMDEMTLDELRYWCQVTQAQLSQALGITQAAVSKLEFRNDPCVSTVRKYVEAIGGKLEIHAVFQRKTVRLRGLGGDENRTLLRGMPKKHCKLNPPPTRDDGFSENHFIIEGMDEDERYLRLRIAGRWEYLDIPVRRILDVSPPPPGEKDATLRIDGTVHIRVGSSDFVERPV